MNRYVDLVDATSSLSDIILRYDTWPNAYGILRLNSFIYKLHFLSPNEKMQVQELHAKEILQEFIDRFSRLQHAAIKTSREQEALIPHWATTEEFPPAVTTIQNLLNKATIDA